MQYLEGVTSGPQKFSGQIGKELQFCEEQQIAKFEPIEIQLPAYDSALSTDQQYFTILLLLFYLVIAYWDLARARSTIGFVREFLQM